MGDYEFIHETSNSKKIKLFVLSIGILVCLIFFTSFYSASIYGYIVEKLAGQSLFDALLDKINQLSPLSLFYAGFFGGSIFIPMPLEFFFYWAIVKGASPWLSLLALCSGFFIIQIVNYWIGLKLNPLFLQIVSKKKVYQTRRTINKYGAWAIFISNLVPAPSELVTFGLGITKYNVYRLFFFTLLGTVLKYLVIMIFAIWIAR